MASEVNTNFLKDKRLDRIASDILRPVGIDRGFLSWMASWGMYISNFVFFVTTSLIGMLISSVTLAVIIISVLMKLFPVISIWEVAEEECTHPN